LTHKKNKRIDRMRKIGKEKDKRKEKRKNKWKGKGKTE
jgi:hypothetical protein